MLVKGAPDMLLEPLFPIANYDTVSTRVGWNNVTVPVKSPHTLASSNDSTSPCKVPPNQILMEYAFVHIAAHQGILLPIPLVYKDIAKHQLCLFCYNQWLRRRLRHSMVRNLSVKAGLTSPASGL